MKALHIDGKKAPSRPQHPGDALDRRRGAEQVIERTTVEDEVDSVFQVGWNRPVEIVNDLRALIAAMVQGALFRNAQDAEKRGVTNELLTFRSPRLPVYDVVVVRQRRRDEPDGPDHIGGVLWREL